MVRKCLALIIPSVAIILLVTSPNYLAGVKSSVQQPLPDEMGESGPVDRSGWRVVHDSLGLPSKVFFDLTNTTDKTITFVAMRFRLIDGDETLTTWSSIRGRLLPTYTEAESILAAGQRWSFEKNVVKRPHGRTYDVQMNIDLVLFEDGSSWGPNELRQRERIAGMHGGCLIERTRLRQLLILEGTDALVEEVLRLEPSTPFFHGQPNIPVPLERVHESVRPLLDKDH